MEGGTLGEKTLEKNAGRTKPWTGKPIGDNQFEGLLKRCILCAAPLVWNPGPLREAAKPWRWNFGGGIILRGKTGENRQWRGNGGESVYCKVCPFGCYLIERIPAKQPEVPVPPAVPVIGVRAKVGLRHECDAGAERARVCD